MSKRHSTSPPARFSIVGDHVRLQVIALLTAVFAVFLADVSYRERPSHERLSPLSTTSSPQRAAPNPSPRPSAPLTPSSRKHSPSA